MLELNVAYSFSKAYQEASALPRTRGSVGKISGHSGAGPGCGRMGNNSCIVFASKG